MKKLLKSLIIEYRMNHIWGNLPQQGWLAVIADRGIPDSDDPQDAPKIEVVGFNNEDDAYNFCNNYDSVCYEWAVITGCICSIGSISDGRDL